MPFELTRQDSVFILTLDEGDNRFNAASLARLNEVLDEVEAVAGPAALVTTGAGKFYSNGLDLDWIMTGQTDWTFADLAIETQRLFARTLTFRRPTVAAINGHCFAAGAMWSLAHDFRVMREDRGFWSMPEVDIKIPFTPGMSALIQARLAPQVAHQVMTTAHRYGGAAAQDSGIVDRAVGEEALLSTAVEMARMLAGKDPDTLHAIKSGMYGPVVSALRP
ncbi:MAG: enoyl-CoA hydratase/isomerase family protein [Acidimicrobiia bacterium]|nr:enoyl-CoA hydratase/isomerase family protein [Acidimicrobiia bacterium]